MKNTMETFIRWFNKRSTVFLLFVIAMANYAGFKLYGGEEHYFAFAREFMDPDWIAGSECLTHPAGGNLLFEIIAGFLLRYISFEYLAFFGRAVNFLLLSYPVARIFRYFRFTNIEIVFIFQLFYLPHQWIFGSEWVFQNLEVKTLSYIFVFYSMYALLKEKNKQSLILAVLATYFHFLAGGWTFFIIICYTLFSGINLKKITVLAALYLLLTAPFIIYLAKIYFTNNPAIINGINTNWVYSYERLPHHLAIFKSWDYFVWKHARGVIITLILYGLCLFYFRRFKHPKIIQLNRLNLILFTQQVFFLIVAVFDRNGTILKVYPFRTSTLSSFFILIELALILKNHTFPWMANRFALMRLKAKKSSFPESKRTWYLGMNSLFLLLFLVFFTSECVQTFSGQNCDLPETLPPMYSMTQYIKTNTPEKAVFLLLDNDYPLSFHRLANRERFVVRKFTPTRSENIYTWYIRQLWKEMLEKDIGLLDEFNKRFSVDYIISSEQLDHPLLSIEYSTNDYCLYRNTGNEH